MLRLASLRTLALVLVATTVAGVKSEWIEVRSPHFLIVSNASEREAYKTAIQFEQIRAVFRQSALIVSEHETPVVTVLALRDENSLRELLPERWTKHHARPQGIFVSNIYKYYVALRTDNVRPGDFATIYHEYFHTISAPDSPALPTWLSEGLAGVFGHTAVRENEAVLGLSDPEAVEQLRFSTLIPLETLFQVDQSSPYYNEEDRASLFYAESWAVAHFLLIADGGAHRDALQNYIAAVRANSDSLAAARSAFGDLTLLQQAIAQYVSAGKFPTLPLKTLPAISERDFPVRPLSFAEAEAYRADFEVSCNSFELARPMIEHATTEDPQLALPHESLAVMNYLQDRRADALAEISKAIERDAHNYLTLYFRAFLTESEGDSGILNPRVESDLRRSIAINPNYAPSNGNLALYLALHEKNLDEALALAEKAVKMEPGTSEFHLDLGQVLAALHRFSDALVAGRRARALARRPAEIARAEQLLNDVREHAAYEAARQSAEREDADPPGQPLESYGSPSPAGDAKAGNSESAPAMKSGADGSSDIQAATGTITAVSCRADGLTLSIEDGNSRIDLRGENFSKLHVELRGEPEHSVDSCTGLQGHRARVSYLRGSGTEAGVLLRVEILE